MLDFIAALEHVAVVAKHLQRAGAALAADLSMVVMVASFYKSVDAGTPIRYATCKECLRPLL